MGEVLTREEAWGAVHEALPARWRVGLASQDVLTHRWSVTAFRRDRGRLATPETVTGTGDDEVAALRDLDDRLRGVPQPDGSRMDELRRRTRLAYVQGAAETWPEMTADELGRVIRRAPPDALPPRGSL